MRLGLKFNWTPGLHFSGLPQLLVFYAPWLRLSLCRFTSSTCSKVQLPTANKLHIPQLLPGKKAEEEPSLSFRLQSIFKNYREWLSESASRSINCERRVIKQGPGNWRRPLFPQKTGMSQAATSGHVSNATRCALKGPRWHRFHCEPRAAREPRSRFPGLGALQGRARRLPLDNAPVCCVEETEWRFCDSGHLLALYQPFKER